MSNSPAFAVKQFMTSATLNAASATTLSAQHDTNARFHSAGIVNPSLATYTEAGMVVTALLSSPFAIEFGSGVLAGAHGTQTNADTQTYAVDFTPLIPGAGSVEAYLLASAVTIQQEPFTVVGPPQGHPSFNPNFVPNTAYNENVESLALSASTTPANNVTTFELARTVLTFGQTTLAALDTTHVLQASSLLAPTGVGAGTYATPTVTVGLDGRITGMVATGPWVQQGTGIDQLTDAVKLGWDGGNLRATVDSTDLGPFAFQTWVSANFVELAGGETIVGPMTFDGLITADGGIDATTVSATGAVSAGTTLTAGTTLIAPTGNIGTLNVSGNAGVAGALSVVGNVNSSSLLESNNGINTAGSLLVGSSFSNTNPSGTAQSGAVVGVNGAINTFGQPHQFGNAGGPFVVFTLNAVVVGSIANSGSGGTNYNTISDERLKENLVPAVGALDRILKMSLYSGNYKSAPGKTKTMFLAHELQVHCPHLVSGERGETKTHTNAVLAPNGAVIDDGVTEDAFRAEMAKPTSLVTADVVLWRSLVIASGVSQEAFTEGMAAEHPIFPEGSTWDASITTKLSGPRYPEGSTWAASRTVDVFQQVDHSGVVPDAVAAIQELHERLMARIAALDAEVATLTAKLA